MSTAGSWSVKGIDPKAREIARDLARRSGLTLGEWLNQMITETGDEPPPAEREAALPGGGSGARAWSDGAARPAPRHAAGTPPQAPASGAAVLSAESFRTRLREAQRGPDAGEVARITRALFDLTGRLEAAEHRSTLAISGIDQQAMGVLSRLDAMERDQSAVEARVDGALGEVRDAQARIAGRLKRMEGEDGPRVEAMKALETALSRVAVQIHEGEGRSRAQSEEVRDDVAALARRVEQVEGRPMPDISPVDAALQRLAERVDRMEAAPAPVFDTAPMDAAFARLVDRVEDGQHRTAASVRALETAFAGLDGRVQGVESAPAPSLDTAPFDAAVGRLAARLDEAQARTGAAVKALESSFADLDQRLARTEADTQATLETAAPEEDRLERLASELNARVEDARADMATRLRDAADGKLDRMASAVRDLSDQVAHTEQRSAEAIDRMGREVVRIAQGLDGRVGEVERRSDERAAQMGGEMTRIADAVENRLSRADGAQAEALEKLGGEIARIAEKLADRIAASERRNAQDLTHGLDEVSEQLQRATDKLNSRYESAAGDLADRIRQSEERTAQLLAEARDRVDGQPRRVPEPAAAPEEDEGPDPRFAAPEPFEPSTFAAHDHAYDLSALDDDGDDLMEEPPLPRGRFEAAADEEVFDPFGGFGAAAARPAPAAAAPPPAPSDPFASAFRDEPPPPPPAAPRPGSTRELIEQARAAARASAERNRRPSRSDRAAAPVEEIFSTPAPGFEAEAEGPVLRSRFSLPKLRRREPSTVKTALYASGTAAFLSVAAVGAVTMMGAPRGHGPVEAPTAAPPMASAAPAAAPPLLAVAETAPEPAQAAPVVATPPAPTPGIRPAAAPQASPEVSGRGLYIEAVRELELGDKGAVDTLKRAANLGYAPAQFHLGKLYEDGGKGVGKDLAQARRWTERAARAGDPKAMFNYGLYLANGEGVAKDDKAAVDWFRRAADGGVKDAQFNLAVMTQQGRGAPASPADAQAAAERSAAAYRTQLAATAAAGQVRTASN